MTVAGCTPRQQPVSTPQITVYFCKAGSDALVPFPFSVNPGLKGERLESALVGQLLAGPAVSTSTVILFPPGTAATVTLDGDLATVNFTGGIAKPYHGGETDEVGLFKSLTYTVTSVEGVHRVQVLIDGRKVPSLRGGAFEIDEPLSRDTFSQ